MPFVGRSDVKDPGAQQDQWERLARRREQLYLDDEQFRNTRPDEEIAAAARAPGAADRRGHGDCAAGLYQPACAGTARPEVITDPVTGRSALRFLPRFETVSYADLWARVQATAADWHHH